MRTMKEFDTLLNFLKFKSHRGVLEFIIINRNANILIVFGFVYCTEVSII